MTAWSPEVANEFIRLAAAEGKKLTQMQLQKLVYLAHGWNLAITGEALTYDDPQAWDYGPVYRHLRTALREYGSRPVEREILNCEYPLGDFSDEPNEPARGEFSEAELAVIKRVYRDYGKFHAFRLSALTHQPGAPWDQIYHNGDGRGEVIPSGMIAEHFVELAAAR